MKKMKKKQELYMEMIQFKCSQKMKILQMLTQKRRLFRKNRGPQRQQIKTFQRAQETEDTSHEVQASVSCAQGEQGTKEASQEAQVTVETSQRAHETEETSHEVEATDESSQGAQEIDVEMQDDGANTNIRMTFRKEKNGFSIIDNGKFECPSCENKYSSSEQLQIHMKNHMKSQDPHHLLYFRRDQ